MSDATAVTLRRGIHLPGHSVPRAGVDEGVRPAARFLQSAPDVDASRAGLGGWAPGGGVAIAAAAEYDRVGAAAALNAVGGGWRTTRRHTP